MSLSFGRTTFLGFRTIRRRDRLFTSSVWPVCPVTRLRIDPPLLFINGKKAEGFGLRARDGGGRRYRGYGPGGALSAEPTKSFIVPAHGFFALGDNSYNSYDSRYWGPVPDENLVGRGLFVYWPFNPHWGLIR